MGRRALVAAAMEMTSSLPYLLRSLYEWIVDNDCTPYIVVDAASAGTSVPEEYVNEGRIVLNISPSAVRDLHIDGGVVAFDGRFGGVARAVSVPVSSVMAIYARENGQGMWFPHDGGGDGKGPDGSPPDDSPGGGKPTLRVVK